MKNPKLKITTMKLTPRFFTTLTSLSLLLGGCGKQSPSQIQIAGGDKPSKPLTAPPEVTSESEEGYHDLVFFLQDHKKLADGSQTLRAAGTYKGRPVGFEISLSPTWKGSSLGKDIPFSVSAARLPTARSEAKAIPSFKSSMNSTARN
jgi:hypothetical protein